MEFYQKTNTPYIKEQRGYTKKDGWIYTWIMVAYTHDLGRILGYKTQNKKYIYKQFPGMGKTILT